MKKENIITTMNIKGLGNDIIEVERIRKSIKRHGHHFLNRLFTQSEQGYCHKYKNSAQHFAGRFAAKEAVAKALGLGFGRSLSWQDIEVLANEQGKPIVHFSKKIKERFHNPTVLVSISHSESYAVAVAIWNF